MSIVLQTILAIGAVVSLLLSFALGIDVGRNQVCAELHTSNEVKMINNACHIRTSTGFQLVGY